MTNKLDNDNNNNNNNNNENAAHQKRNDKTKAEMNEERKIIQNKTCVQNKRKHRETNKKNHPTIFFFNFFLYKEKKPT
jgi:hypothetical protein